MKNTKTMQNAKNYSNNSNHIIFDALVPDVVLGGAKIGSMDVDDIYDSYDNTIENIVQDLSTISVGMIGDIIMRNEKTDPSGFPQVDTWNFKSNGEIVYSEDTHITILGKRVLMVSGTKIENVVIETFAIIQAYIDEGLYFSSVKTINNTTLEVEYNDRRIHDPQITSDDRNIIVDKTITREMISGYGQWIYLGNDKIKFVGVGDRDIHYYQRVG